MKKKVKKDGHISIYICIRVGLAIKCRNLKFRIEVMKNDIVLKGICVNWQCGANCTLIHVINFSNAHAGLGPHFNQQIIISQFNQ